MSTTGDSALLCIESHGLERFADPGGARGPCAGPAIGTTLRASFGPAQEEDRRVTDHRTWAGTLIAAVTLAELGATEDLEQAEKNVLWAVDAVAERLGNTRDIARISYISPRVIGHYMEGSVIAYYGELV